MTENYDANITQLFEKQKHCENKMKNPFCVTPKGVPCVEILANPGRVRPNGLPYPGLQCLAPNGAIC